jgi:hypothetical protein
MTLDELSLLCGILTLFSFASLAFLNQRRQQPLNLRLNLFRRFRIFTTLLTPEQRIIWHDTVRFRQSLEKIH